MKAQPPGNPAKATWLRSEVAESGEGTAGAGQCSGLRWAQNGVWARVSSAMPPRAPPRVLACALPCSCVRRPWCGGGRASEGRGGDSRSPATERLGARRRGPRRGSLARGRASRARNNGQPHAPRADRSLGGLGARGGAGAATAGARCVSRPHGRLPAAPETRCAVPQVLAWAGGDERRVSSLRAPVTSRHHACGSATHGCQGRAAEQVGAASPLASTPARVLRCTRVCADAYVCCVCAGVPGVGCGFVCACARI